MDFPHPDGPMIAVISQSANYSVTPFSARSSPKYALRFWVASAGFTPDEGSGRSADGDAVSESATVDTSVCSKTEPRSGCESREKADDEHHNDQHEGAGPCLSVRGVVGADRVSEDLERQRRDRLTDRC